MALNHDFDQLGFCNKAQAKLYERDTLTLSENEIPFHIKNKVKSFEGIKNKMSLTVVELICYLNGELREGDALIVEDLLTPLDELEKKYGTGCANPVVIGQSTYLSGEKEEIHLPDIFYTTVILDNKIQWWNSLPSRDRDGIFYYSSLFLTESKLPFVLFENN